MRRLPKLTSRLAIWLAALVLVTLTAPSSRASQLGRAVENWESTGKPKNVFTYYVAGNRRIKHGWDVYYYEKGGVARKYAWLKGKLNGPYESRYPDGTIKEQGNYVAHVLHGPWLTLYPDGSKARECTYAKGKIEGELKEWYANGQLRKTGKWLNGRPEGEFRQFSADGKTLLQASYKAGLKHGQVVRFTPTGQRYLLLTYKNGKLDGEVKRWSKTGEVLAAGTYRNGDPWDGVCWEKGDREGFHYLYTFAEGELVDAIYFSDDEPFTGMLEEWHPGGVKARQCDYVAGRKEGWERWFYPDGTPAAACKWKANKLTGVFTEWHRNGEKKSERTLADGKLNGPEIQWDMRGNEIARGENRDDKPWSGMLLVTPDDPEKEAFFQEFNEGRPVNLVGDVADVRSPQLLGPRRAPDAGLDEPTEDAAPTVPTE